MKTDYIQHSTYIIYLINKSIYIDIEFNSIYLLYYIINNFNKYIYIFILQFPILFS